ncbi:MAG TPA: nucleotidyl transferase AbiEii/AbiGii toxin family protein [Bacteroidales bacterium]|jgi:predicted nucleotidyltransferase component of viral defense system|nr:nucleotidyl transferase AbiEii/AbiGii toxin family protein [Bacteroidales bacterium]HPS72210.1 nucleotidyl transferase AbiEii/AbiGii toxin family protein [Bacteroidales bacterium]
MILHQNNKLFYETLRHASQFLNIKLEFVEKDYWITLVLNSLASSKYSNEAVFKGGTSLSKGYNIIERFSEDVDIAIMNNNNRSGNEIKTIIRNIEKEISRELIEIQDNHKTSKGSRFRKSVFNYVELEKHNNNTLIIEINSFANPFPFQECSISSMVYDFLNQNNNAALIEKYNLQPFKLNVLIKEQTLLEKIVSLIRFSYQENVIESISGKIRHFYDLYYLMQTRECVDFVESKSFKESFSNILNHDKKMFEEPRGWQEKQLDESQIVSSFPLIWEKIKGIYQNELSALAYRPIPDEILVAQSFMYLIKKIL